MAPSTEDLFNVLGDELELLDAPRLNDCLLLDRVALGIGRTSDNLLSEVVMVVVRAAIRSTQRLITA